MKWLNNLHNQNNGCLLYLVLVPPPLLNSCAARGWPHLSKVTTNLLKSSKLRRLTMSSNLLTLSNVFLPLSMSFLCRKLKHPFSYSWSIMPHSGSISFTSTHLLASITLRWSSFSGLSSPHLFSTLCQSVKIIKYVIHRTYIWFIIHYTICQYLVHFSKSC